MDDQTQIDMGQRYANAYCAICKKSDYVTRLHGDAGGPMCCLLCRGEWHAKHGRRIRTGRIVVRALNAYSNAGGSWNDVDKLRVSGILGFDPLGYIADTARPAGNETVELISELLADVIRLTHPDQHPPERKELAERVTKGLLQLQPFVFPAPKPKLVSSVPAPVRGDNRDGHLTLSSSDGKPKYPCTGCADTTPYFYCTACRTEYDKREHDEAEAARAKQRAWYAGRPKMWTPPKPPKDAPKKPRTARQARVANQNTHSNLTNHWLSGLQIAILRTACSKRVPGARGADVSHAELLVEIWGWTTRRKLRWTEEEVKSEKSQYRVGDTRPRSHTDGAFKHIPRHQRRAARASLSRALGRLAQRELISFVRKTAIGVSYRGIHRHIGAYFAGTVTVLARIKVPPPRDSRFRLGLTTGCLAQPYHHQDGNRAWPLDRRAGAHQLPTSLPTIRRPCRGSPAALLPGAAQSLDCSR